MSAISYQQDKPLNVLVEPETIQADLRTAAALGQDFLRIAKSQLSTSDLWTVRRYYIAHYQSFIASNNADAPTKRFLDVASANAIDGIALYRDFKASLPSLPAQQVTDLSSSWHLSSGAIANLTTAAVLYVDYFEKIFSIPPVNEASWTRDRLEYKFELSAAKDKNSSIVLSADEYRGGKMDWYSFSLNPSSDLASSPGDASKLIDESTLTVVPSHLHFRGMPNRRWWQFEDAQIDMGSIDVNKVDIPRMALINMVVNQANDWFIMPFQLNRGTITRIKTVTVTDTFGKTTNIQPANLNPIDPARPWKMFTISTETGSTVALDPNWTNFLFLPPISGQILDGQIMESINFLRDQMADMVWGVEDTIQNPAGDPVPGFVSPSPSSQTPTHAGSSGSSTGSGTPTLPQYVLMTDVPLNWIPFLPVQVPNTEMTELQEAAMLLPPASSNAQPQPILPRGVILQIPGSNQPYYVREEEVPREGTIVTRRFRRTRWTDGSTYLWIGRRRDAGKGEGSSGLRFDSILNESSGTFE